MTAAMVMPCFRWSIARTRACFESARLGLFDESFLSDIVEILCSVGVASCAATTEAPHGRESPRGRIPEEPLVLYEAGPVTLCFQQKSSPFWIILWLAFAERIIQRPSPPALNVCDWQLGTCGVDRFRELNACHFGHGKICKNEFDLERECQRNVELVWLTGRLMPDFKTIADFLRRSSRPA
jgi:hypothetical protein